MPTGELVTLAAVGIREISTSATATSQSVAGNTIRATGTVTFTDNGTAQAANVVFDVGEVDTVFPGNTTISPAAAEATLKGYGTVTDPRAAMIQDATRLG